MRTVRATTVDDALAKMSQRPDVLLVDYHLHDRLDGLDTLDALRAGYDVYVVEDAIGGVSPTAHHAAMRRMEQAGARPITVIGLAGELQRDWGRESADRLRAALGSYFGGHRGLKSGGRP